MSRPFAQLRDALLNLSLEPNDQRIALSGAAVADELALDLAQAVESLDHAEREAGAALPDDATTALLELDALLSAPAGSSLWNADALDTHPTWADARRIARSVLAQLPSA